MAKHRNITVNSVGGPAIDVHVHWALGNIARTRSSIEYYVASNAPYWRHCPLRRLYIAEERIYRSDTQMGSHRNPVFYLCLIALTRIYRSSLQSHIQSYYGCVPVKPSYTLYICTLISMCVLYCRCSAHLVIAVQHPYNARQTPMECNAVDDGWQQQL